MVSCPCINSTPLFNGRVLNKSSPLISAISNNYRGLDSLSSRWVFVLKIIAVLIAENMGMRTKKAFLFLVITYNVTLYGLV